MWVKIDERNLVNVDAKVVRIRKDDLQLSGDNEGITKYYLGFYETFDINEYPTQQLPFDSETGRDNAFDTINVALETIDITMG